MSNLLLEVAATQGMRELLAAHVFARVRESGVRVRVEHDGVLRVTIWLPKSRWALFGAAHLLKWWAARRIMKNAMKALKIYAPMKVRVR